MPFNGLRRLLRPQRASRPAPAPLAVPAWRQAALALEDGAPLGDLLGQALAEEIAARAAAAGAEPGWAPPKLTDLRVCKRQADWWLSNGNLVLRGPGADDTNPEPELAVPPPIQSVVILGAKAQLHRVHTVGTNALIALGDQSNLYASTLSAGDSSTILIGHNTVSTFDAKLNARNGGAIVSGDHGLWAAGVRMFSDDMHAIRDARTNQRLNERGGRIIIGPRVWLGEQVQFFGSSRVGGDTVIGAGSFIRGVTLPANTVCVGRPARPIRRGIIWSLSDDP